MTGLLQRMALEADITNVADNALGVITDVAVGEDIDPGVIVSYLQTLPEKIVALGFKVVVSIVILVVMLQVIKAVSGLMEKSLKKTRLEDATARFLSKLTKVTLDILLIFFIAESFGVSTAGIVALLGSAGVAIGLAIQGTLSDFAGGLLILIAKPFRAGDYIVVGSYEGTVQEISLINTRLLTPDRKVVIIPNGSLASDTITNNTGYELRVLDIIVSISYTASIEEARKALLGALDRNEYIVQDRDKSVFVDELADSGVVLRVRGWVDPMDYMPAKWSMNEQAKLALDAAGVEIPFPQVDVHVK